MLWNILWFFKSFEVDDAIQLQFQILPEALVMYNVLSGDWTFQGLIKHRDKQQWDSSHVPKGQEKTQKTQPMQSKLEKFYFFFLLFFF